MTKTCISCAMPMESAEDFPLQDVSKDYCCYCAKANGELQSFDERLESYSEWLVSSQGLDKNAALSQAKSLMAKMPAWKKYF